MTEKEQYGSKTVGCKRNLRIEFQFVRCKHHPRKDHGYLRIQARRLRPQRGGMQATARRDDTGSESEPGGFRLR